MPDLYPLLLQPQFHERVWGTRDLTPFYAREVTGAPIGEAWLTGDDCCVTNGSLKGRTLGELANQFGARFLGDAARDASRFPLLIKFLFPTEKLSVQVHPDDEGAAKVGQPCGKTECWYVLRAGAGAQVGLGLKAGTTKAEVEAAIREKRMEHLLNWIGVHEGDMIYVDAGTVHAIGAGVVIVETQQNSDTTYRLYDYGRPRELHIEDGLRVTKEHTHAGRVVAGQPQIEPGKEQINLVTSPCFIVDHFKMKRPWEFRRPRHARSSVWCLVATRGCGVIENEGAAAVTFTSGETVAVPAAVDKFLLKPQWELEFLCASLPVEKVEQPATVLFEKSFSTLQR
ncbi:MAG TPA: type I phosphomannose isomerase catalytic subunit [Candidatus Polarisedimenticolia bacterium]|jgi:mannose-6-phosphate isomerase|nr:type I phosphomannose isomerase catalytic subunit [Candidatus Polarisedimenticolia bacterium]